MTGREEERRLRAGAPHARAIALAMFLASVYLLGVPARVEPLLAAAGAASRVPLGVQQSGRVSELAPGKLLVAARELTDPNFAETVIFLTDHAATGAVGLIVNRRTDVPLSRVFAGLEQARGQSAPVYLGGPVSVGEVQALMRSSAAPSVGRQVGSGISVVSAADAFEETLASRHDPSMFRVYLGYAGWSAGQLEREVGLGAWHIYAGDADVVFDAEPDGVWLRQIRRTEWRMVTGGRGGSAGGTPPPEPARSYRVQGLP